MEITSATKMPMPTSTDRILWIDAAKGIGIILVVFGHVERGLVSSKIVSSEVWHYIDYIIYTFHMPLFFYLSGLTIMGSLSKPDFFHKRVKSILVPYLIFSVLNGLIQVVFSASTNNGVDLIDVALIPIIPITIFWFLYVLFIYSSVVAVWRPNSTMLFVSIVMLLASALVDYDKWITFDILYFFVFFVAGAVLPKLPISRQYIIIATAIFVCGITTSLKNSYGNIHYYSIMMLPVTVSGIVMIVWLSQKVHCLRVIIFIGKNAIAIYVMHIIASSSIRIIMVKIGIENPALHFSIGLSFGIVMPLLALRVLQKINISKSLGLP